MKTKITVQAAFHEPYEYVGNSLSLAVAECIKGIDELDPTDCEVSELLDSIARAIKSENGTYVSYNSESPSQTVTIKVEALGDPRINHVCRTNINGTVTIEVKFDNWEWITLCEFQRDETDVLDTELYGKTQYEANKVLASKNIACK